MRKLLAVLLAVGVIGGVAGCSESNTPDTAYTPSASWYDTGDGRVVWCIGVGVGSSLSCDWENARPNE